MLIIFSVNFVSDFSSSAGISSAPADFPLLVCQMAILISSIVDGVISIWASVMVFNTFIVLKFCSLFIEWRDFELPLPLYTVKNRFFGIYSLQKSKHPFFCSSMKSCFRCSCKLLIIVRCDNWHGSVYFCMFYYIFSHMKWKSFAVENAAKPCSKP